MRKKLTSESGVLLARLVVAFMLCTASTHAMTGDVNAIWIDVVIAHYLRQQAINRFCICPNLARGTLR